MTIFPARKRASLSSLHFCLCLCCCVVLHVSFPHDENVTFRVRTSLPLKQEETWIKVLRHYTTNVRHSNFSGVTYEINVDRRRTSVV